jgi:hypothetical protein
MFSLADQHATAGILAAAGFTDVAFTDVREPVYYGADSYPYASVDSRKGT